MARRIDGQPQGQSQTREPGQDLEALRSAVRAHYAGAARAVLNGVGSASCCGDDGAGCGCGCGEPEGTAARAGYDPDTLSGLPPGAVLASLGCGNPTALATLRPGEVVLDLGSGGGIDVLLSAQRVGPRGFAYGLDMTTEMLELAERNRMAAGIEHARFLRGQIEAIPLPDASVDVVISNCVINLSGDKDRVLAEAFRVLRPGGRFAVSDIVVRGRLLPPVRRSLEAWSACVAGALSDSDYRAKLAAAGFVAIEVERVAGYGLEQFTGDGRGDTGMVGALAAQAQAGEIISAFVRARKPE